MNIYLSKGLRNYWLPAILVVLVTFPKIVPVFANGIDPPLSWVFNYLIQGRLNLGKDIIFPHGPLAFIMYPLPVGSNLWISMGVYLLARILFAYSLITSGSMENKLQVWGAILSAFVLLAMFDILMVITGIVILGYLHYLKSRQAGWLILSISLTSLAFFIKAFVGIVCGITSIAFFGILIFEIVRKESSQNQIWLIGIPAVLVPLIWFLMYGTFNGLFRYFNGMKELAGDNSAAVAYYPFNNWLAISVVFGCLLILFLIHCRKAYLLKYFLLVIPALFAVWKYGMAREDYLHSGMYFLFILLLLVILNLIINNFRIITIILSVVVAVFSYLNLQNSLYFEPPVFSVSGLKTITTMLTNYGYIADTSNLSSSRSIERNVLDPAGRTLIGRATVDVFPWDYSFIPANHLNWMPRPVLQSYASYTPWLDNENASHFLSPQAPQFLIWELRKITHDIHNGTMESIDGRYLLNDQPETMLSILSNYRLVHKQHNTFPILIFEKRKSPLHLNRKIIRSETSTWNTWVEVPKLKDGVLRVNTGIQRNWMGNLKSILYKDEACYIYYLLSTNEIRMYRIVPRNAANGIWVNPLIMNAETSQIEPQVKKIMFRCSNPQLMSNTIELNWESIDFDGLGNKDSLSHLTYYEINHLFEKDVVVNDYQILNSKNDLEAVYANWSFNPQPERNVKAFSGSTSCKMLTETYSTSFQIQLDSLISLLPDTSLLIRASAWINTKSRSQAILVISVEREGKSVLWKPVELENFIIEKRSWNYACNFLEVSRALGSVKGTILKVYIWNKGKDEILVDDMQVIIEK